MTSAAWASRPPPSICGLGLQHHVTRPRSPQANDGPAKLLSIGRRLKDQSSDEFLTRGPHSSAVGALDQLVQADVDWEWPSETRLLGRRLGQCGVPLIHSLYIYITYLVRHL